MKRIGYIDARRIKGSRPAVYHLTPQAADLPGFADGYGTPAGSTVKGDNHPYWTVEFDADAEEGCWWHFMMPPNFDPTENVKARIHWYSAAAVAGEAVWGASVLGVAEGEVWDAPLGDEVEATETTQDVAGELTVTEIALTPAQHALAAGDAVALQLKRKAADGDDTLLGDAIVAMVEFEFAIDPRVASS